MSKTGKGRGSVRSPLTPLWWMPVLTMGLCFGGGELILRKNLPEASVGYIPFVFAAVVSCVGAYCGARRAQRNGFLWGMVVALAFGGMLMLGNLCFFGEGFFGVGETFLWIAGGGFVGGILANLRKGKIA